MIRGGLKDTCETQETVAAASRSSLREVSTYTPFDSNRSVFCLTFASIVTRLSRSLGINRLPMRSLVAVPARLIELPVLGSKEVEQQAIVPAAVDVMALPLPADEAEAEAF
jgi:hypothetical protein